MFDKVCFLFYLLQIYVYYFLIFKQQGQILQAKNHETANKRSQKCCAQETKIPCVATVWNNLDEEHSYCTVSELIILKSPKYLGYKTKVLWGREVFHKSKLLHTLHMI